MATTEMGVGLVFSPGFERALEQCEGWIDLIEIETQTIWLRGAASEEPPRIDSAYLRYLSDLPYPKLVHGVGFPAGGTRAPDARQLPALRETLDHVRPPWFSEHLGFNRARHGDREFHSGMVLPPRQTAEGLAAAVRSVQALQKSIDVPLAIETGVSYLRPLPEEIPDGAFFGKVVEQSGCGILLDLHNLWTNEKNGRQRVDEYLNSIPLDQVWELHLAGGRERQGFWLNTHSDEMPKGLFEMSRRIAARLPNLRAVVFELTPENLRRIGIGKFQRQLEFLRRVWDARGWQTRPLLRLAEDRRRPRGEPCGLSAQVWEDSLGCLVTGLPLEDPEALPLAADPGVDAMRYLIRDFRGSLLARNLPFTCRLLMLHLGEPGFLRLCQDFWAISPPELFGSEEARAFRDFLVDRRLGLTVLDELLAFELATIETLVDGEARVIRLGFHPLLVLQALGEGRMPDFHRDQVFEIEIATDGRGGVMRDRAHVLQTLA